MEQGSMSVMKKRPVVSLESHLYKQPVMDRLKLQDLVIQYLKRYDVFANNWTSGLPKETPEKSLINLGSSKIPAAPQDPINQGAVPIPDKRDDVPQGVRIPDPVPIGIQEPVEEPRPQPAEEEGELEPEQPVPTAPLPDETVEKPVPEGNLGPEPNVKPDYLDLVARRKVDPELYGPERVYPEMRLMPEVCGLREKLNPPQEMSTKEDFNNILNYYMERLMNEEAAESEYLKQSNAMHDELLRRAQAETLKQFDSKMEPGGTYFDTLNDIPTTVVREGKIGEGNSEVNKKIFESLLRLIADGEKMASDLELDPAFKPIAMQCSSSYKGSTTTSSDPADGPNIPNVMDQSVFVGANGAEIQNRTNSTQAPIFQNVTNAIKKSKRVLQSTRSFEDVFLNIAAGKNVRGQTLGPNDRAAPVESSWIPRPQDIFSYKPLGFTIFGPKESSRPKQVHNADREYLQYYLGSLAKGAWWGANSLANALALGMDESGYDRLPQRYKDYRPPKAKFNPQNVLFTHPFFDDLNDPTKTSKKRVEANTDESVKSAKKQKLEEPVNATNFTIPINATNSTTSESLDLRMRHDKQAPPAPTIPEQLVPENKLEEGAEADKHFKTLVSGLPKVKDPTPNLPTVSEFVSSVPRNYVPKDLVQDIPLEKMKAVVEASIELKCALSHFLYQCFDKACYYDGGAEDFTTVPLKTMIPTMLNVVDHEDLIKEHEYVLPVESFETGDTIATKIKLEKLTSPWLSELDRVYTQSKNLHRAETILRQYDDYVMGLNNGTLLSQSVEERRMRSDLMTAAKELISEFKIKPYAFNDWQDVVFNEVGGEAFVLELNNRYRLNKIRPMVNEETFNHIIASLNSAKDWNDPAVLNDLPKQFKQAELPVGPAPILTEGEVNLQKPESVKGPQKEIAKTPFFAHVSGPKISYIKVPGYQTEFTRVFEELKSLLHGQNIQERERVIDELDKYTPYHVDPFNAENKMRFNDYKLMYDDHNFYNEQFKSVYRNLNNLLREEPNPTGLVDFISGTEPSWNMDEPEFSDANYLIYKELAYADHLFNKLSALTPVATIRPMTKQSLTNSRAVFVSSILRNALGVENFSDDVLKPMKLSGWAADNQEFRDIQGEYLGHVPISVKGTYKLDPQNPVEELYTKAQLAKTDASNLFGFITSKVLSQIESYDYSFSVDQFQKYKILNNVFYSNYPMLAEQRSGWLGSYVPQEIIGPVNEYLEEGFLGKIPFTYENMQSWYFNMQNAEKYQGVDFGEGSIFTMLERIMDNMKKQGKETMRIEEFDYPTIASIRTYLSNSSKDDEKQWLAEVHAQKLFDEEPVRPKEIPNLEHYKNSYSKYSTGAAVAGSTVAATFTTLLAKMIASNTGLNPGGEIFQYKGMGRHKPHTRKHLYEILHLLKNEKKKRIACGVCNKKMDKMYRPENQKSSEDDLCQSCFDTKELSANGINPHFHKFNEYDNKEEQHEAPRLFKDFTQTKFLESMGQNQLSVNVWNAGWFDRMLEALLYSESHSTSSIFKANLILLISKYLKTFKHLKQSNRALTTDVFQSKEHLARVIQNDPSILANYHP